MTGERPRDQPGGNRHQHDSQDHVADTLAKKEAANVIPATANDSSCLRIADDAATFRGVASDEADFLVQADRHLAQIELSKVASGDVASVAANGATVIGDELALGGQVAENGSLACFLERRRLDVLAGILEPARIAAGAEPFEDREGEDADAPELGVDRGRC